MRPVGAKALIINAFAPTGRFAFINPYRGCVKTPNINKKKLVVRSCVDVQRVFVFLQKRAL
ncbi:hypothetical protein I6E49_04605 [Prevotella stercorea]|uniref:hypothetical protein n=1 Tax=Leyella stercorea TaxID=363265 RepID=UPI001F2AC9A2|nr:hypothetical protein [Leyella stercorea]MCF2644592.1 hypothetical protein [Leyella stercorea]